MARTHGHGNPKWTREETILALGLYQELKGHVPTEKDNRVKELSELLWSFPYHVDESRRESFRNPAGVAFKLQNIRQVATGAGLKNVSAMDRLRTIKIEYPPEVAAPIAEEFRRGKTPVEKMEGPNKQRVAAIERSTASEAE